MQTKLNLRRSLAVLVLAAAVAALVVASAGASPKHAFAPKVGTYGGDSFAEGKTHAVSAKVEVPVRTGPR
ncbi:MAG TPA: hypothetical protein VGC32_10855 [Solirubrobacterales bacterium]